MRGQDDGRYFQEHDGVWWVLVEDDKWRKAREDETDQPMISARADLLIRMAQFAEAAGYGPAALEMRDWAANDLPERSQTEGQKWWQ